MHGAHKKSLILANFYYSLTVCIYCLSVMQYFNHFAQKWLMECNLTCIKLALSFCDGLIFKRSKKTNDGINNSTMTLKYNFSQIERYYWEYFSRSLSSANMAITYFTGSEKYDVFVDLGLLHTLFLQLSFHWHNLSIYCSALIINQMKLNPSRMHFLENTNIEYWSLIGRYSAYRMFSTSKGLI